MRLLEGAGRLLAAGVLALVALGVSAGAGAANPLAKMSGSWSGAGEFRLQDGRSERIRCNAFYAPKGRARLGLALRCASAGNRIELRASLVSRGSRVSGSWEERSYNAAGTVSGVAAGSSLRLAFDGGVLSGVMVVTTNGRSQSISVRTDTSALRGVNISLRRN
jgi:hypothetical protein